MVSISLCMIVKNEERLLPRCLASVRDLVEEIVLVDTGSTDATVRIGREFGARLFHFPWRDDFAEARNFSFCHGTGDFIFWLDADDVLSEKDRDKFRALKATLSPAVDAVSMRYELAFDDRGEAIQSLRRHRLLRRAAGFRWHGAVHEYVAVAGRIVHSDVAVQHRPGPGDARRNLRIYEKMIRRGDAFTPRDTYYYANELKDHRRWDEAVTHYERFLAMGAGWVEDNVAACLHMSECFRRLKREEEELAAALRALRYGYPRPEACCRIGEVFFRREEWSTAIFWYSAALAGGRVRPEGTPMFENAAYTTWVPHRRLALCYERAGSRLLAHLHNEQAAKYKPKDPAILRDRLALQPGARDEWRALQVEADGEALRGDVEQADPNLEDCPDEPARNEGKRKRRRSG